MVRGFGRRAAAGLIALSVVFVVAGGAFAADPALMLHNSDTTGSTRWSGDGGWGLANTKYGVFTCATCHDRATTNVKRVRTAIATPDSTKGFLPGDGDTISFQTAVDGSSDFGDDSTAPRPSSGKVCEVCHTYDAGKVNGVEFHAYDQGASATHYNNKDCVTCHKHSDGFKATCAGCHTGYPEPPATAAHATHAGSANYGYACTLCHPQDHDGDATDIAFTGVAATWGGATYTSGTKTCNNLYCHGSATADWDDTLGGTCGDCHGDGAGRPDGVDEPANGSHTTVAHQVACTNCHSHDGSDTTEHVDGKADANGAALVSAAGTSIGGYTYAGATHASSPDPDGYDYTGGTCATIVCHNNGSADWGGGPLACSSCHSGYPEPPATAAHATHAGSANYAYACSLCHPEDHDGDATDIAFSGIAATWGGATYTAAGKTCNNLYCHGSATADWDGGSGGTCGDCHGDGAGRPDGVDEPAGGSHLSTTHAASACTDCHSHDGSDTTEHVNGPADSAGDALVSAAGAQVTSYTYNAASMASSPDPDGYKYSGGTCATSCHTDLAWGDTGSCDTCHPTYPEPPATAAHVTHAGSASYAYACGLCHPQDHDGDATDIAFSGLAATWGGATYTAAGKTCNNLYCHGSATADWDAGTGGTCGDCHGDGAGRPDGVDEPANGSHTTASHAAAACTDCHSHDGSDKTEHVDGKADANGTALVSAAGASIGGYTYAGATHASSPDPDGYDYTGGTCATIACHNNGSAAWGGGPLACADCHSGYPEPPATAAHATHAGSANYAYACSLCHPEDHDGDATDIAFSGVAATWGGASYTAAGKTCNNLYCHGSATADWDGGTGGTCGDCHGDGAGRPDGVDEPANGSHTTASHAAAACTDCHSHDGSDTTEHVDGKADANGTALVSAAGASIGGYTYAGATHASSPDPDGYDYTGGTCATIACHNDGSAAWGGGPLACADCHAGYPEPPATAAHATHAGTANYAYACTVCHPQDHDGDATDIVFTGVAATWGTESYNSGPKTCSNLYCHGSATADWDGGTGGTCGDCHGDGAGRPDGVDEPANGSHLTAGHLAACTNCHSHDGSDTTEHVDGMADASGVALVSAAGASIGGYTYGGVAHGSAPDPDGYLYTGGTCATIACHNNGSADWGGGPLACADCHAGYPEPPATAAHATHAGTANYAYACSLCHPQDHDGDATDIAFSGLAATWGGATYTAAGKTCNNLYCHGSATADWDAGSGGTCGDCHGDGAGRPDGVDEPANGSHLTASHAAAACTDCHSHDGSDTTEHVDGKADANGTALVSAAGASIGGYTYAGATHASSPDPDGYDYTGGTCATIACHNNGSADWGGGPLACADCHAGYPEPPATAAHATHAGSANYGYACSLCHPEDHDGDATDIAFTGVAATWGGATYTAAGKTCATVYCHGSATADWDGGTGGTCGDCHGDGAGRPDGVDEPANGSHATVAHQVACTSCHSHDGSDTTEHVDGKADANGAALVSAAGTSIGGYTYAGATHVSSPDPDGYDYTGGTCATIVCHNNGSADWGGGPLACSACHSGYPEPPATAAHATHAGSAGYGYACTLCHPQDHDGVATDIVFTGVAATWGGATYTSGVKTCATVYCHGSATADWDGGTGGACGDCHGDGAGRPDGVDEPANGSHTTAGHLAACTSCHSHDGTDKTEHVDGKADANGTALVSAAGTSIGGYTYAGATHASSPDPDGYDYTGGTCSTIACHNNGSADWGGGPLACSSCHSGYPEPPATAAHATHAGSGIGQYGYACTLCHPQDHDGVVTDIAFSGIAATWGGATYTSGVKTCATVYCHGAATADWDGGTGGACGDCHGDGTGRPDTAGEPTGGSHLTGSHAAAACTNCHSHDGSDTTEHANGPADAGGDALVSAAGSSITSYTYGATMPSSPDPDGYDYSAGTCATSCHGDNTWGNSGSCDMCHAYPPDPADGKDNTGSDYLGSVGGKGAHAKHVTHIANLASVTLLASSDTYGDANTTAVCGVCHDMTGGAHETGGGTRNINFNGDTTYQFGPLAPSWTAPNCSNISCHFTTTPDWE